MLKLLNFFHAKTIRQTTMRMSAEEAEARLQDPALAGVQLVDRLPARRR